jgi:hypothetical protein
VSRAFAVATQGSTWLRHFTDDEYTALVIPADKGRYESSRTRRQGRREFIEQWPDLGAWMTAPVADRLMHAAPYAESRHRHVRRLERENLLAPSRRVRARQGHPDRERCPERHAPSAGRPEPMKNLLEGGCLCGALRYQVDPASADSGYCQMCQKASGAPAVAWFTVNKQGFA